MAIPKTCLAIKLVKPGKPPVLEIQEIPVPKPKFGQVLIRMEFSPIQPADIVSLYGGYGNKRKTPFTPGLEGSGVVVASGGGIRPWLLMGKKVNIVTPTSGQHGGWQQYLVMSAYMCIPVRKNVTLEQAAVNTANPTTAIAVLDTVRRGKHKAIVQNAAAGSTGQNLYRYLNEYGIKVVNIVRSQEQVDILQGQGFKYVFNSNEPDFKEKVTKACQELKVTCAFDCIGGEATSLLCDILPVRSTIYVYGNLSNQKNAQVSSNGLVFKEQIIKGF